MDLMKSKTPLELQSIIALLVMKCVQSVGAARIFPKSNTLLCVVCLE